MPELPEVEHLRRSLVPLLGRTIRRVLVARDDVIRSSGPHQSSHPRHRALLHSSTIADLQRHGKQLALLDTAGRALVVQLGMTGSLQIHAHPPRERPTTARARPAPSTDATDHVHVRWLLDDGSVLSFRDPRRFGGLTPLTIDQLRDRWAQLGPDALTITTAALACAVRDARRPIKPLLLDQARIAGVGNIYADEALFLARIHPLAPACSMSPAQLRPLAAAIRRVLTSAIARGGSSIRDYRDASGASGRNQRSLLAYGRAGLPCTRCNAALATMRLAQRATVFCPRCQAAAPA